MMFRGYRISPFLPILIIGCVMNLVLFIFGHGLYNIVLFGLFGYITANQWDTLVEKIVVKRDDDDKPDFERFRIDK